MKKLCLLNAPLALLACWFWPSDAMAEPFSYLPPGDLITGSGEGRVDELVYAPGMRFPMEAGPAYANSQVYSKGGSQGPAGGQCDPDNYAYPWRDNYCEIRQWDMPLCPAGTGHQGQDIRAATCEKDVHWAVAVVDGTITNIGSYSVYLTAADGTRYDYLHMSNVQVAVGQDVTRGQRMGLVSNNFGGTATTIHLHFNIRQTIDGVGNVYVPPYTSLIAAYQALMNPPPEGVLDAADCKGIRGWTYDPSTPDVPTYAMLSFDDSGIEAATLVATVHREDLCSALNSCDHGFSVDLPLSLLGKDNHEVQVYGVDTEGGPDAELVDSPKSFNCPLDVPTGVRRLVADATSMDAWRFSNFWDVARVDQSTLESLPAGIDLPLTPTLVRASDGSEGLWLIDNGYRREVDDAAAGAWEFEWLSAEAWSIEDIEAVPAGPALRLRPFLIQSTQPAIYLVDDALPGIGSDSQALKEDGSASCQCNVSTSSRSVWWMTVLAVLALARRKKRK